MPKPFSTNPDRTAAVREQMDRQRKAAPRSAFDRGCERAAAVLERCVAEGVTSWAEIAPRLREVAR